MAVQSMARVLIIDNDPRVGEDLRAMLEPLRYRVEIAQGAGQHLLEQAVAIARSFRPHVTIVDLRLLDEYRDERSGLELLGSLRSARRILYSAYLTPEVIRKAVKKHGATGWVSKGESPQQLLNAIAEAARESCACQGDLSIYRPAAWTSQQIIRILFDEDANVSPEIVEDTLSQLFPENTEITLETVGGEVITPIPVSRGRSVVLKVRPDDLEPVVVKLAPAERIRNEYVRYREHVKDRLIGRFYAQLERMIEFWELGGVTYNFLGSSLRAVPSFTVFYRREMDPQVILRPLRHFFKEVWSRYYGQPLPDGHIPLFQTYDEALRLKERLGRFSNQEERMAFPGLPVPLINPVSWVLRHASDSLIPSARQAITHGDFHGDNLFVEHQHAWAIDFERTGAGHILRDFVELEVDIATRFVPFPRDDLSQFYKLAVVLAEPIEPTASLRPTAQLLADSESRKALDVIGGLRRLAYEVTRYSDFREYVWGLLFDALFVASLVSEESSQRDLALLLGSVLCGRLYHWGKEWPPKDWPPITWGRESLQILDIKATKEKGARTMLPSEQQAALMVLTEATKFLFSELGKKLDFWGQKKGEKVPQAIEPKPGPGTPAMKLDDLEQVVNTETLYQVQGSIKTSLDILRKLTRERDGHRKELLTDTLLDPKTRAWFENKVPELEKLIEEEATRLQELLDKVYQKQQD